MKKKKFEIKGFEDGQVTGLQDLVDQLTIHLGEEVKEILDDYAGIAVVDELSALLSAEEGDDGKYKTEIFTKMQAQLDQIATDLKNGLKAQMKAAETPKDFIAAIRELLDSKEFKDAKNEGFTKKKVFDVKVDTSVITGDVNRTVQNLTVSFAPENQLAFIPNFGAGGTIGQDKNRVLWVEGAYTSNVGYVTEGTGQATADTGTAVEKGREMAKISAKLPLTSEMLEDADYVASAFRTKLQEKSLLFTDGEAYDGDGSDGGNPKHIYGIQGHATAFNATTAGVNATVDVPNIGDAVDAGILQCEKSNFRSSNILWLNPSDFYKWKKTKTTDGDYVFVKDINGTYSVAGLRVIRSNRITANTMLLADTSKLQYWTKRMPEIKFSQMNGSDFVNDAWTAVLFVRSQVVVEAQDKLSLIYFSDVDAAVDSLEKL